ncbi:MAG: hypothetical protein ACLQUY_05540 [Ktedonobacterales bacterium]
MRDATLRWGLGMGLASAALGIFALLVGAFFFPIPTDSTADSVAVALLVRGMLVLSALGATLGLAYYAGLQVERDRLRDLPEAPLAGTPTATSQDRIGSLIAGLLVSFCWWFGTTLTGYLLPLLPQTASSAADPSQLVWRLILGAVIVMLGTGLGGLGARMVAARAMLDRVILSAQATTVPLSLAPPSRSSSVASNETPRQKTPDTGEAKAAVDSDSIRSAGSSPDNQTET